jgi:hypothetical protein
MNLSTIFKTDIKTILKDCGNLVLEYQGTTRLCKPSSTKIGKVIGAGGFLVESDLSLMTPTEEYTSAPIAKEMLRYNNVTYRIESVSLEPLGAFYVLECTDTRRSK